MFELKQFKDEGGAGRGRDRFQLLLKEKGDVNLDDVKKYDDADDADSGDDLDSSDSDDDSDDDEEALEKELEKIRKEREEARKKKVGRWRGFKLPVQHACIENDCKAFRCS